MARRVQSLRGFSDLLPGQTEHWLRLETAAHQLCGRYGFREIRPPHVESTQLFVRSVGESTDIIGKEMFSFDSGGDSVSLRPEITASVCRAFIEHGLDRAAVTRLYYIGSAFRRERPQKGRLREFHQIGVEVIGEPDPEADVEVLALARELVRAAGVERFTLRVNSIGDQACRPAYRERLIAALEQLSGDLCAECQGRIQRNPLRVLDCKKESCKKLLADMPKSIDHLCDDCRDHFELVLGGLKSLAIEHVVDPTLVRGLDYYVRTTFEIQAEGLGAQDAVLGGGRYDGLLEDLGGPRLPGLGWAAGIERLLLAAGAADEPAAPRLDAYVVTLGARARKSGLELVQSLRAEGLAVGWDTAGRGVGGQMKRADRSGARFAVLVGDDELDSHRVTVKDLKTSEQRDAPLEPRTLAVWLGERIGDDRSSGRSE